MRDANEEAERCGLVTSRLPKAVLAGMIAAIAACTAADMRTAADRRIGASAPTTPPAQVAVIAETDTGARYGDSTTFDPDGYYVPLVREGALANLEHIELRTLEYSYDGSDHLDRPRILPPVAVAVFRSGGDSSSSVRCEEIRFDRDSLNVACANTPAGRLGFRLRLLDPRGRYARLAAYDEQEREIAAGEVSVLSPAGVSSVQRASFYYFGGE